MKNIIFSAFLLLLTFLSSGAQKVNGCKGFFDIYGGIGVGHLKDHFQVNDNVVYDFSPLVAFGLNFTGGYQINKMFFTGIGFGAYTNIIKYHESNISEGYYSYDSYDTLFPAILLPVFVDCRWTLDLNRKITPFIDLKIGYQFSCQLETGNVTYNHGSEGNMFLSQDGGLYFQPTVGVRFGKESGFNLGITYNPTIHQKLSHDNRNDNITELKKYTQGALMLSFGADF